MPKYCALLFDADATLFDFNKSSKEAFRETMEHFEIPYSQALHQQYREINQSLWNQLEGQTITPEEIRKRRFAQLFEEYKVNRNVVETDAFYLSTLGSKPYMLEGAAEVVIKLAVDFSIYIITNGMPVTQRPRMKESAIAPFIEAVFISEEIGYAKPDTRFFDYVFTSAPSIEPKTSLVVGDSLSADITGGAASGIDTCWYNPTAQKNMTTTVPTYEVQKLEELYDILT